MFHKKCNYCKNKIKKSYEFCPYCGRNTASINDKEDYGILGKKDLLEDESVFGFGDSMMDKMFGSAMKLAEKMLERQMKSLANEMNNPKKTGFNTQLPNNMHVQFFVNGKRVFSNHQNQQPRIQKKQIEKIIKVENNPSQEQIQKLITFPKKEPVSKFRRVSGKIIYEIAVPGVQDLGDIFINPLENSIEIKALAKDKIYSKTLKLNLPIISYNLEKGNLILELQVS